MFAAALLAALVAGCASDDYRDRDAAERDLTTFAGLSERSWADTRRAYLSCGCAEAKPRIYRAWISCTTTILDGLVPAWHPVWPVVMTLPEYEAKIPRVHAIYGSKLNWRLEQWNKARGGYSSECPQWYYSTDAELRDAFRTWAVRELALTGDVDAMRSMIFGACLADRRREMWKRLLEGYDPFVANDPNAVMQPDVYWAILIYDPAILNRRYFDGHRTAYRADQDPAAIFWGKAP